MVAVKHARLIGHAGVYHGHFAGPSHDFLRRLLVGAPCARITRLCASLKRHSLCLHRKSTARCGGWRTKSYKKVAAPNIWRLTSCGGGPSSRRRGFGGRSSATVVSTHAAPPLRPTSPQP